MNIVAIHSSPAENGVTSSVLHELEAELSRKHEIESFRISDLDIKPCTACMKCRPDRECILPADDAHMLAGKIRNCDLMIIAAPVFWGNMPGTLKIFFDRCVTSFESADAGPEMKIPRKLLNGKKAVIITAAASPFPYNLLSSQSGGTIRSIKTILKSGGVKILNVINIPAAYRFTGIRKDRTMSKAGRIAASIG